MENEEEIIDYSIYIKTPNVSEVYKFNNYSDDVQKKVLDEDSVFFEEYNELNGEISSDNYERMLIDIKRVGKTDAASSANMREKKDKEILDKYRLDEISTSKSEVGLGIVLSLIEQSLKSNNKKSVIGKKSKKLREKENER